MSKLYPPTIIYDTKPPDIRLRYDKGEQIYFCRRNRNLYLTDRDLPNGTYEAGGLLGALCREFCFPRRESRTQPCPGFIKKHMVWSSDESLADVTDKLELERCLGVRALLDICQTDEERHFLLTYLNLRAYDEYRWRDELIRDWNRASDQVEEDFFCDKRDKLDRALWATMRFPALIPQVWLNYLTAASEKHIRALDENPSRVDFVAFYNNQRHIIEIDGPSHYSDYRKTTGTYTPNERAYARNLRVERSLRREDWVLTRIARIEVRDAMAAATADEDDWAWSAVALVRILPFEQRYPERLSYTDLGLPELAALDPIPF
jgi:hypothetical protein